MCLSASCDGWLIRDDLRQNPSNFLAMSLAAFASDIRQTPRTSSSSSTMRFSSNSGKDATSAAAAAENSQTSTQVDFESLIDMDVVIYSLPSEDEKLRLGAMQEDGVLSPLSAWTTEPAFGSSIEFLVDEADRFVLAKMPTDKIRLHHLLSEEELSYGSRQCHRGVGNPHGEESELLYYVEQDVIDKFQVQVYIKPDLEILW
jgi:hypothetical protein